MGWKRREEKGGTKVETPRASSILVYAPAVSYYTTGAALHENNEASAKLTTANGGTFTSSSARLSQ